MNTIATMIYFWENEIIHQQYISKVSSIYCSESILAYKTPTVIIGHAFGTLNAINISKLISSILDFIETGITRFPKIEAIPETIDVVWISRDDSNNPDFMNFWPHYKISSFLTKNLEQSTEAAMEQIILLSYLRTEKAFWNSLNKKVLDGLIFCLLNTIPMLRNYLINWEFKSLREIDLQLRLIITKYIEIKNKETPNMNVDFSEISPLIENARLYSKEFCGLVVNRYC